MHQYRDWFKPSGWATMDRSSYWKYMITSRLEECPSHQLRFVFILCWSNLRFVAPRWLMNLVAHCVIISEIGAWVLKKQVQFSLLSMGKDQVEIKNISDSLGIRVIAYSPLGLGMLAGKYTPSNLPSGPRYISPFVELNWVVFGLDDHSAYCLIFCTGVFFFNKYYQGLNLCLSPSKRLQGNAKNRCLRYRQSVRDYWLSHLGLILCYLEAGCNKLVHQ